MNKPIVTAGLLSLGLALAGSQALASEMQERFRESGKQLDLTGFLQADNDARSRSFFYGGVQEHDFTVKEAGTYRFESRVPAGESEEYRIEALLLDKQGNVLARSEALGQNGGLSFEKRLEPGDYVLQVQGNKFGTVRRGGNSFSVSVAGVGVEEGVSAGEGIAFTGTSREGGRNAFVRRSDVVAPIAVPAASGSVEASQPARTDAQPSAVESSAPTTPGAASADSQAATGATAAAEPAKGFERVVTDVKIRARGEVLSFEVLEAGTVAIATSTFPGNEGTYRIEAEVVDEQGRVVASDAGEGFDGDIDLRTELQPGRYTIRVKGQKFGSAMSGVNNYELEVRQLDRR
ncbi:MULTISPECIES: hypothetical protein [unclassified Halomonas]|uniref:hypothetical protein n=1 Tax=unclassified Halomonas TaxID=2609666 RepID=UPI0028871EF1|nr:MULTISPECIES: hypothetical protein [unclassified Halomonas]MDT0501022.1 hypothetical protein [Halomonas sp. PAR7]MDT0593018.1 hypothetical protein [Halomonas sp. PAR8]